MLQDFTSRLNATKLNQTKTRTKIAKMQLTLNKNGKNL